MSDDDLKSIESTDGYDDDDEECWADDEYIQENAPARNSVTSRSSSNWKTPRPLLSIFEAFGARARQFPTRSSVTFVRSSHHAGGDEGQCAVTKVNNYAFCGDVAYLYDNEQGAWKVTMDMSN
eukprot:scaffold733_cov97-Cylindrotheca_fusiformis.AAC.9